MLNSAADLLNIVCSCFCQRRGRGNSKEKRQGKIHFRRPSSSQGGGWVKRLVWMGGEGERKRKVENFCHAHMRVEEQAQIAGGPPPPFPHAEKAPAESTKKLGATWRRVWPYVGEPVFFLGGGKGSALLYQWICLEACTLSCHFFLLRPFELRYGASDIIHLLRCCNLWMPSRPSLCQLHTLIFYVQRRLLFQLKETWKKTWQTHKRKSAYNDCNFLA